MNLRSKPVSRIDLKKLYLLLIIVWASIIPALTGQSVQKLPLKGVPKEHVREFQFLAYFFNKAVTNNIFARNDFLKGQTVGRLFGGNTTSTSSGETFYFEQRLLPFFIYKPKLLNGRAILRASFEIDWTWGDIAYSAGGNFGSAISADQVNIQTQNVELELIPVKGITVNLGLQRLFDTPYNPYRTFFSAMTYTGYRLAFWGTDAVGITVRHDRDFSRFKAGYYQLYENNIQQRDDVVLWEFMYERDLATSLRGGLSFWYVMDRANGEGGVSILGQGLNSTLNQYNGVFRFPLGSDFNHPYKADVYWAGGFWTKNAEFDLGRLMYTGFAVYNFGTAEVKTNEGWEKRADISGYTANVRLGYRYGQTARDAITMDFIYATGDEDSLSDGKYSGVITGNTWGSPGAIFISSGAYILFPHGNVVNRYISAVTDLSNIGLGVKGLTINLQKDIIPNKLSAKAGFAYAVSQFAPFAGGKEIGKEINGRIGYKPAVFMEVELHAAYLWLGDFYKSSAVNGERFNPNDPIIATEKPNNPWTTFLSLKWLMF